jgi:RNAse (barnase) inhibitor barstar
MTDPVQLFKQAYPALICPWQGSASVLVDAASGLTHLWWLRGSRMRTRPGLMDEWAAAAQFPPYFGGNWDALRDALSDLPEGGTFLVFDAQELLRDAAGKDLETLLAVLREVRKDLAPKPFRLILQAEAVHYNQLLRRLQGLGLD